MRVAKLIAYLTFAISPIVPLLVWMGILVFLNITTTIWRGVKGKTLSAKAFGHQLQSMIESLIIYFSLIVAARGVDIIVKTESLPFTVASVAIGIICLKEFKVICENVFAIKGVDIWGLLGDKVNIFKKP